MFWLLSGGPRWSFWLRLLLLSILGIVVTAWVKTQGLFMAYVVVTAVLLGVLVWAIRHPLPPDAPTGFRRAGQAYGRWQARRQPWRGTESI